MRRKRIIPIALGEGGKGARRDQGLQYQKGDDGDGLHVGEARKNSGECNDAFVGECA